MDDPMYAEYPLGRKDELPEHTPITAHFTQWDDGDLYWVVTWTTQELDVGVWTDRSYKKAALFMNLLLTSGSSFDLKD